MTTEVFFMYQEDNEDFIIVVELSPRFHLQFKAPR